MVFTPPDFVPKLPFDPPDHVTIPEFILSDDWKGRHPLNHARPPFVCGLTGKSYTMAEVMKRVDLLTRGLAAEMGWKPNEGGEWDKVVGVFAYNTLDTIPLAWATHRLGGISTPANAAYSQSEVEHQMRDSGAKCIFTCVPLLDTTLKAAETIGIPKEKIFLLEMPESACEGKKAPKGFKTVDDFIKAGEKAPKLDKLKLSKGDGAKRTAFLCYSSGTSGLPKGVMIAHRNVIANTVQIATFDSPLRAKKKKSGDKYMPQENVLGLLPMSHIYGLVLICHASLFQGDSVVVLPKFDIQTCLNAIAQYKINFLYLVPPIIILFTKNRDLLAKYDLSSVEQIFTGAAPLGEETAVELQEQYPKWIIRQGYGLTETCTVVCSTNPDDIWFGSSGCLLPGYEAKIVSPEGKEITEYGVPGELWAKSPSVVLGYLNNAKSTAETFKDGYMLTGDEVMIKKSPKGNEHLWIVDRIKELIKVKGLQVAPAELEAHLLTHPAVADTAVIQIPDADSGERPKAYVVKSPNAGDDDEKIIKDIKKHVETAKSRHKWLKEVEFIDVIPKSPSGKILRRMLRDQDKETRRKKGAKM